jgi:hypothetical protein
MRMIGTTMADISDRSSRIIGALSGRRDWDDTDVRLAVTEPHGLLTRPAPWWQKRPFSKIVTYDDFETGFRWVATSGSVSQGGLQGEVFEGTYSLKMLTSATAGATAGARMACQPTSPAINYYKCLSGYFALGAAAETTPRYFMMNLEYDNYSRIHQAKIRYLNYESSTAKHIFQYYSSGGVWTDIPASAITLDIASKAYIYFELWVRVIDVTSFYYALRWGDQWVQFPESTQDYESTTSGKHYQRIEFEACADADAATTGFADGIILAEQISAPTPAPIVETWS